MATGSISTQKDSRNRIRYRARWRSPEGRSRERVFDTRREAEAHLATIYADIRRKEYLDPSQGRLTLREVAEEWSALLVTQRPRTVSAYDTVLRTHVLPYFGDRPVESISPHDVKRFVAHMVQQGKAPGTVRNSYRVLKPVLDTAVDMGCIRRNPCAPLKRGHLPRTPPQEMRFLSGEQVSQLATLMPEPFGVLVYFAAYTGMRAGEIAAIRMPNLDFLHGRVRVVESLSEVNKVMHVVPPKTGEARDVMLPAFLCRMLEQYLDERPPVHGYLFTGRPPRGLELSDNPLDHRLRHSTWFYPHVFKPRVRKSFPGLRFHDLRHTCASLLIERNVQMKAISRQLGHSSIQITMDRYGHLLPSVEASMASALDDAYSSSLKEPAPPVRRLRLVPGQ